MFIVRLTVVLAHEGWWGVDGGAYLLSRNHVLGDEPTGADFVRPPLAPGWQLVPFTAALGDDLGLKAWALLASFALVPALLLIGRAFLTPWQRVFAVFVVSADWALAEMWTAGVLPMQGFALMLACMWGVWRLRDGWDRWGVLAIAASVPLIAYTNQTSVGIAAYSLPVFTVALWLALGRPGAMARRVGLAVGVGAALAATALPWYGDVGFGSPYLRYPGPLVTTYALENAVWYQAGVALLVGALAVWKGPPIVKALGATTVAASLMAPGYSFDESLMNVFYRSRYWSGALAAPLAVWLVARYPLRSAVVRPLVLALVPLFALMWAAGYGYQLHAATKLGRMVTSETDRAIAWIEARDPQGAIVTNSYSMSLYVAAITRNPAPWSQIWDPPPAYKEQHANVTCLIGWRADCDPKQAAARLDAEYVLVETLWPSFGNEVAERTPGLGRVYAAVQGVAPWKDDDLGYIWGAPEDRWERTAQVPWLEPVWREGNTKVWKVRR